MPSSGKIFWPRVWHTLMLMAGIALVARYDVIEARTSVKRAPTLEELRAVSPEAANATRLDDPIPHYRASVETAAGSVPAAIVSTTALPPAVKGYVDEINTLVVVDDTGAIRGIKVIADRETPEYMRRVLDSGFLERFMGKSVTGASGLDKIDAVTGATITATAIRDDVASAAALAAGRVFNLSAPAPALPSWAEAFKQIRIILVMAALALALYARFGRWPARGRREAAWVVSLFVIGFWAMTPYTMTHICQLLRLDWPGPGNALLLVLASYVLVTTLLFGPLWCACSCPFGALEELLAKLPIKRWKVSPGLMRYAREARFLVLFICVVGVFGLGLPAFSEVEPFGHLFGRTRNPVAWAFIASVLFGAVFIKRFWCRFFCPTGACLMILSSHRRLLRSVGRGVDDAGIDRPDAESPEREE